MAKVKVAVIGSGNIGTDLMMKIVRLSDVLEMAAMAGIDPESDGLARAARHGVATTHAGVDGLLHMPVFDEISVVFDATSAKAHHHHSEVLLAHGKQVIDLTPAAIGPCTVPSRWEGPTPGCARDSGGARASAHGRRPGGHDSGRRARPARPAQRRLVS